MIMGEQKIRYATILLDIYNATDDLKVCKHTIVLAKYLLDNLFSKIPKIMELEYEDTEERLDHATWVLERLAEIIHENEGDDYGK
ncbi:MAG: hypothetical protein Q4A55_03445 [Aerococcus sp.]|nr:hypothetical protein [Aerococcus sp.]